MSRLLIIHYYLLAWRFDSIVISALLSGFCSVYSGITSVPVAFVFLLVSPVLPFFFFFLSQLHTLTGIWEGFVFDHGLLCLLL